MRLRRMVVGRVEEAEMITRVKEGKK